MLSPAMGAVLISLSTVIVAFNARLLKFIQQEARLFNRAASLGLDFFRNDFTNQVVVDVEDPKAN
jgi:hypothetical protein